MYIPKTYSYNFNKILTEFEYHMKSKILFALINIILFNSCQSQEYHKDIVDLESFNFKLNTEKFYEKSMKRENIKFSSEKQYVEKDTIYEYDIDWQGDRNKIFAIQYRVGKYSSQDIVAKYKDVNFFTMESMVDDKKNLMIINAVTKVPKSEIDRLIVSITNLYETAPKSQKIERGFRTYSVLTWNTKGKVIKIATNYELDFENTGNILTEKEKEHIQKTLKNELSETILYICDSKYQDMLLGKLGEGNWIDFD